jgi:hypothetical protein
MRGNLGPRDDMESLIYLMFYLLNGKLPWSPNMPVMSEDMHHHLELQRVVTQVRDPESLCQSLKVEPEFIAILQYLQGMAPGTMAKPDYRYLRRCFNTIKDRKGLQSQLKWFNGFTNETDVNKNKNS